ncbi:RrF2 family transcriptional regulator [Paenibacillus sp. WLX2291]|uniref:RrF2 family transcriptional regulator n=1 Tax=Paenibacillus sp. WLX2291 TaxID=3296934 RepID=UPI0039842FC3
MKFSKATNYALHTMLHLSAAEPNRLTGVQQLADQQQVSPTYLSKILTKLAKAGMVESSSGANGGYRLRRNWEEFSFLDVIHAIEGTTSLFECHLNHGSECLIEQVMVKAEGTMEDYLRQQKLSDLTAQMRAHLHR